MLPTRLISPLVEWFKSGDFCRDYTEKFSRFNKQFVVPFAAAGAYQLQVGKKLYFPHDTELSGSHILAFDTFTAEQQAKRYNLNGVLCDVISLNDLAKCTVTFCDAKNNIIAQLPAASLNQLANNGKHSFVDFKNISWGNCYIEFSSIAGLTELNIFVAQVYYNPK